MTPTRFFIRTSKLDEADEACACCNMEADCHVETLIDLFIVL